MNALAAYQDLLSSGDNATIRRFQESAPIDVVGIAKALGLKVYHDTLPEGVSGKIIKDEKHGGDSGFSIVINDNESYERQRFTIAHEISHYLLHRDKIGNGLTDDALYRSGLSTLAEVRANKLAADILMPFDLIEKFVNSGVKTVQELASNFRVSAQAMRVRLEIPE